MKSTLRTFVLICLLGLGYACWGWSFPTHRAICGAAFDKLDADVKAFVIKLGGSKESFVASCTWADDVRETTHLDTYEYHFINLKEPGSGLNMIRDCEAEDCVTNAIKRYSVYLRNYAAKLKAKEQIRSREKKNAVEALKFLGHFVGDLHQPLHVGRAADLGGNDIKVIWKTLTRTNGRRKTLRNQVSLHSFWDSTVPSLAGVNSQTLLNWWQTDYQSSWVTNDLNVWAAESWDKAENVAYVIEDGSEVPANYVKDAKEAVREQALKASVRLAYLLNESYKGSLNLKN